jgi:hypothetical protein
MTGHIHLHLNREWWVEKTVGIVNRYWLDGPEIESRW